MSAAATLLLAMLPAAWAQDAGSEGEGPASPAPAPEEAPPPLPEAPPAAGPSKPPPPPGEGFQLGRPQLRPLVGANVFAPSSGDAIALIGIGAAATVPARYDRPGPVDIVGNARVSGQYFLGSSKSSGAEVQGGVFAGPQREILRLTLGPNVFWSRFQYGSLALDPVTGVGVPVIASADAKVVYAYGGLEPSWFVSGDRPGVDWSEEDGFGFGDEYAWLAGGGVNVGPIGLGINWSRRATAIGPQQGVGFSVRLGG
jgi:hypothetical protein